MRHIENIQRCALLIMVTKVLHSRDAHTSHLDSLITQPKKYTKNFTCKLKSQQRNYVRWLFYIFLFFFLFQSQLKTIQRSYKCNQCVCMRVFCVHLATAIHKNISKWKVSNGWQSLCTFSRRKKNNQRIKRRRLYVLIVAIALYKKHFRIHYGTMKWH